MSTKRVYQAACVACALLLAMLGLTVYSSLRAERYRHKLELIQLQALQEVSSNLGAISADLQKAEYAGTPAQLSAISAKVWKDTGAAKAALGSLPSEQAELEETYRFLSQAGDYSMYLSRKTLRGEEISPEERENFVLLTRHAKALDQRISELAYQITMGELSFEDALEEQRMAQADAALPASLEMEEGLDGYPTLIYDGPFSDNLLQKKPSLTQGKPEITPEEAGKIASAYTGISPHLLARSSDEQSRMPCYTFASQDASVSITMQGGYAAYLLNGREIGPCILSFEEGRQMARNYLEDRQLGGLSETYYELANGVLTINYAFTQEDITCYTDLVKVGIAMDDGEVVFYDARGFLNNHKDRSFPEPILFPEEAQQSLSPALRPVRVSLALIPTAGLQEVMTYEFHCKGRDNEDVLVYVNTQNGAEEQIFILIHSENGTLAI